jgi:DNA-binding NtrC family response regulator
MNRRNEEKSANGGTEQDEKRREGENAQVVRTRILVIDDNEQVRSMLGQMLTKRGFEIEVAPNGENAAEMHRRKAFEVVITDIIMPGKEGLETIGEFRRLFPDVKIIAISGGGRIGLAHYLETAKRIGAHKTMAKPFRSAELVRAIEELLEGRVNTAVDAHPDVNHGERRGKKNDSVSGPGSGE